MHNGGVKLVVDESAESMLREWVPLALRTT
jgi:hypothetical protein